MTDEEIEKDTIEERLARRADEQEDSLAKDTLDYINRLKEQIYQAEQKLAECENGYQATLDLERRMRADDKEQIRKGTAKEIIQLMKQVQVMFYDKEYVAIQNLIAEKYGVEVDDDN